MTAPARLDLSRPDPNAGATGRQTTALSLLLALAALAAESGLAYAYATGRIGWPPLLLGHAVVVVLLAVAALRRAATGVNAAMPMLTAIAIAAAGPTGALAALAAILMALPGREDPRRLADWYERIALAGDTDDATRLCEDVATGRTADLTGPMPHSFSAVMEHGTLEDRQAALGIIARNFDPSYLPVLKLALRSPEPMIRVQAAAVATRIRGNLRTLIDRHASVGTASRRAGPKTETAVADLQAAIDSGLLDEGDRIRGEVLLERLRIELAAGQQMGRLTVVPVLARAAHEQMLLGAGRYADLRVGRRVAVLADSGRYRIRRPGRRATAGAR